MKIFGKKNKISPVANPRAKQKIDRKTYVIHHYCPHTFNAGDHFVIRSIRKHLQAFLPEAIFVPKASAFNRGWGMPVRLTGKNITFSNRYADAVIVGGSDQYNNWSLRIRKDEIRQLIPPLYLIGLGISSRSLDAPPNIEKKSFLEDIRVTNEAARFSSVRDEYTRRFLEDLGFHGAVVTGCPAMFLFDEPFHVHASRILALSFPFPVVRKNEPAIYEKLLAVIRHFSEKSSRWDLEPVIVCHDDRDVHVAQEAFPEARIFFSNYVDEVFDFYQNVTLVLGSRLHASILVSGLGKPFVNINIDARGKGFSETFGLRDWNLDIDAPDLIGELETRVETILNGDLQVFDAFYGVKSRYREIFLDFMKKVARDIRQFAGAAAE